MPQQKFIHQVDAELSGDAAYKTFASIEGHALTPGTTVRFFPGVYELGSISLDNISFEGAGNREHVVLANAVVTAANTVSFRNVTFSGNSDVAGSTGASIHITNASNASSVVKFDYVNFVYGDFGVDLQGLSKLHMNYCDGTGVDRLLRSNAVHAANVNFTMGNLAGNAWFTGANAGLKAVTTFMTYGGAANTGNTSKTARSAV